MVARSQTADRVPRLLALPIVLAVSLAMWAGIVVGLYMLLKLV
jgi:hypothetical protein